MATLSNLQSDITQKTGQLRTEMTTRVVELRSELSDRIARSSGRSMQYSEAGPSSPEPCFFASVCAAPTLNAAGQSRVTLSLR